MSLGILDSGNKNLLPAKQPKNFLGMKIEGGMKKRVKMNYKENQNDSILPITNN